MLLLATSSLALPLGAAFAAKRPCALAAANLTLCLTSVLIYSPMQTPQRLLQLDKVLARLVGAWLLLDGAVEQKGVGLFAHAHLAVALFAVLWLKTRRDDNATHSLLHVVWMGTVLNSTLALR